LLLSVGPLNASTVQAIVWLFAFPRTTTFSVLAGDSASLTLHCIPVSQVLDQLETNMQKAKELWHGEEQLARGADQELSNPWALGVCADLVNLLGINCGDK
jgi:hypothetical protein